MEENGLNEWSKNGNPRKIVYADAQVQKGKKMQNIWEFQDPAYPDYPTQKNIDLLKSIILASSNPGDLVLNCFGRSGTTLVASKELGRSWIGIDRPKPALSVSKKRLERI